MLTYDLKKAPGVPLYEALYRCIREDILQGSLVPGQKLPSKRSLAQNLELSVITVEAAYNQLLSEGYLRSVEKVGYFVETVERRCVLPLPPAPQPPVPWKLDLTGSGSQQFPFSVWVRLQREVMLDYGQQLLQPLPNRGLPELRQAIAQHLSGFRGMDVDPENILVGAGTDFLYNLLIQLLGRELVYAVEEPGYGKIRKIYAAAGATCRSAPMDGQGVCPRQLEDAQVLHLSPSHHFPTGLVTPVRRRLELLAWAGEDKWIIEDDYDSEFRFDAHPIPAMQTLDRQGRVIYMNTFSRSLAPSIRISYLVLPGPLMERFQKQLGFYSCTVPSFEQYTLARFLSRGHFEKHINRMRKFYKNQRNALFTALRSWDTEGRLTLVEQDAGVHFLLGLDTRLSDRELVQQLARQGIRIHALRDFYHDQPQDRRCLVVNYATMTEAQIPLLLAALDALLS